ncbi:MAG: hypothetical protein IH948_03105 [Bacteroidetes bacterium]|nr:hypothetical protein [Bacteroidota bacterium]
MTENPGNNDKKSQGKNDKKGQGKNDKKGQGKNDKKSALDKFWNIRNIIALIFVVGYFSFLFYSVERGLTSENPVLTLLLGIMSAAVILIVQFYFRRSEPQ